MAKWQVLEHHSQQRLLTRRSFIRSASAAAGVSVLGTGLDFQAGLAASARAAKISGATEVTPVGKAVLAQADDFHEIDPHRELWSEDSSFHFAIFDSLIQRDDHMNLVPILAESYQNNGPTEWTFKLRQGIKFHNGEPLTVETIQWNVEDAIAPGKKRDVSFEMFDHVEKIDNTTFKLFTKHPDPLLLQRLVRFFILPAKYFQEKGEDGFIQAPVGSGPYKFVERKVADHIAITASDSYWRGNAHIKDALFRIVPDVSTQIQALKAGEIDFMFVLPPDQLDPVNHGSKTKAASVISDRVVYGQFVPDSPQGKGELRDTRVRQAINFGVNMDNIIKYLLAGLSTRVSTVLPPDCFAFDKTLQPYPYDPEKAKALLKEAGFEHGFDLTIQVASDDNVPNTPEIAQAMQQDLNKIGLRVTVKPTETATMVDQRAKKTIAPIYIWNWGSDFLDPEPTYRGILYTQSPYTFYGKPTWDKMIDEAALTLDQSKRMQIYTELQKQTQDDPPWLFMYAIDNVYGLRKSINFTPRTDERVMLWEMSENGG